MSNTITEVRLLSVPLENDYMHSLYFDSVSDQITYFSGKTVKTGEDFSYQRKDKVIRYPLHVDSLLGINYVMYKNSAYSSKWFYAFITKIEYVNDGLTNIYIETDAIQTWLFDYEVKASFIEREHVADDTAGLHTYPEGLELGEYVCSGKLDDKVTDGFLIVIAATMDLAGAETENAEPEFENVGGTSYGKTYSGVRYFAYSTPATVDIVLANVAKAGKSDGIVSMFMCPSDFLNITETGEITSSRVDPYYWSGSSDTIARPGTINGYSVKNQKLLTYPFNYLMMSNNSGNSAIYKYEQFNDPSNCDFSIYGTVTPGFSCRIMPRNYNGVEENNEEGLNLGKYPICNWNTDTYTNWMTQNSVNIGTNLAASGIGVVASIATLDGEGVVSGLTGVANTLGQVHAHSLIPPQSEGNINSGDVTFASGNLRFSAYKMSIKAEYARIIDGYFDMYGYKVNRVKVPEKNHRESYWFTKTIDVNIDGAIPMEDMQTIKDCYNKGITFWRRPEVIQDYSIYNPIVNGGE